MLTMHRSGLVLCLLVYLALDFANPLMPGAVRFDRGSVDVVQGDRARAGVPTVCVELAPTPEAVVDRLAQVQALRRPRLVAEPGRPPLTPVRCALPPSSDPATPSEDH
jgi:hypothetical protein